MKSPFLNCLLGCVGNKVTMDNWMVSIIYTSVTSHPSYQVNPKQTYSGTIMVSNGEKYAKIKK